MASYNDIFIQKLIIKYIREKKESSRPKKNRKVSKEIQDNLLKLKPKYYKNISKYKKQEIKIQYEIFHPE